jgi:hypothetical protein
MDSSGRKEGLPRTEDSLVQDAQSAHYVRQYGIDASAPCPSSLRLRARLDIELRLSIRFGQIFEGCPMYVSSVQCVCKYSGSIFCECVMAYEFFRNIARRRLVTETTRGTSTPPRLSHAAVSCSSSWSRANATRGCFRLDRFQTRYSALTGAFLRSPSSTSRPASISASHR